MDRGRQQELFEEIKAKTDIVAIISEYVTLKKSGRSLLGLCPFHSEKTPSFNVNQSKQFFYCFGCGAGGDVFSFLMRVENLEFIEAARRLAERAGIQWPELQPATETDRQRETLLKINFLAAQFFNYCLTKTEPGERARNYLQERGIQPTSWERFGLGYAPPGWHNLTELFRKKGVSLEQAETLGLVGLGENGFYDRFRERVIFPITDLKGKVLGFGGRIMDKSEPKYLNSPETPVFHKGRSWFGLHLAKESIRKLNQAVIVEGYLDAIQAHQAGFLQTVASLGTALTREQSQTLTKFTSEVILAYDADAAGQNATIRGMELLQQAGLQVKVLSLPEGDDPDSFIKSRGSAAFAKVIEEARSLIEFQTRLALVQYNLKTPEGKTQAIAAVFPYISTLESPITREAYMRQLAREVGVSEAAIFSEFQDWRKSNRKKSPLLDKINQNRDTKESVVKIGAISGNSEQGQLTPLEQAVFKAEKELLNSILQEYDKLERIKEELKPEEFSFQPWRELYLGLLQLSQAGQREPDRARILEELTGPLREAAAGLLAEQEISERPLDPDEALKALKRLKLKGRIDRLTEEINSGKDLNGSVLTEPELKAKMKEFTELRRQLSKEFPNFLTGI